MDPVRAQYEALPYPARDPADEARRLITGSPSRVWELNHVVFAGRRDFRQPFRALVAGGGTGDGCVMLAQQLADLGGPAEVVYVDLSAASRAVAEARVKARGLSNVAFHTLSLLDLPGAGLGRFDYIDCSGVLHHLDSPDAGLAALTAALAPGGGMGIMLYGELGRTGVYHAQEMLRMIAADGGPAARLDTARRLVAALPATNWLKRNPFVTDHLAAGDAGLFDLLLHGRDRAYRVTDIRALLAGAGLRLAGWAAPAAYAPEVHLADPRLRTRLAGLDAWERAAFAELLAGNLRKHVFYAVSAAETADTVAKPAAGAIPVLADHDPAALARTLGARDTLAVTFEGARLRFPLPRLAAAIVARLDGRRTLDEVRADLARTGIAVSAGDFDRAFAELFHALNGIGALFLCFAVQP